MFLSVTSLNSGSNGNCYYIGNGQQAILVDAGISCRETEKRMARLGLSLNHVSAVFVSHEHTDHINGVSVIANKYQIPVYITAKTLKYSGLQLNASLVRMFNAYEPVAIGNLVVTGFPKFHDASEPHSFIIESSGVRIGVLTDIGYACKHVIENFKLCHAAFLEANYDEQLLEEGRYPYFLKKRIKSDTGHLSNRQALELFTAHKPAFMTHLFLSHLSKDNNCPQLVQELFTKHASNTEIIVASRYQETAVYQIYANSISNSTILRRKQLLEKQQHAKQLSLF